MDSLKKRSIFRVIGILLLVVSTLTIFGGILTPLSFVPFAISGVIILWVSIVLIYLSRGQLGDGSRFQGFEDRLRQLERLKSDELITEDEYESKRTQIMDEKW